MDLLNDPLQAFIALTLKCFCGSGAVFLPTCNYCPKLVICIPHQGITQLEFCSSDEEMGHLPCSRLCQWPDTRPARLCSPFSRKDFSGHVREMVYLFVEPQQWYHQLFKSKLLKYAKRSKSKVSAGVMLTQHHQGHLPCQSLHPQVIFISPPYHKITPRPWW